MFQFCDHIAQKIEMPFLDYEIGVNMPNSRCWSKPKRTSMTQTEQPEWYADKDSSIEELENGLKTVSSVFEQYYQNKNNYQIVIKHSNIQTPKQLEMRIRLRKKLEQKKNKKK